MVRIKHRYLLVNILYPDVQPSSTSWHQTKNVPEVIQFHRPSSDALDGKLLARIIRDATAELFGDYGTGMIASGLKVIYLSPATSTTIIRVAREHYRLVWAALTCTTHLPKPIDRNCVFRVVRVSGTIRKAEEEAIKRAKESILRVREAEGGMKGAGAEMLAAMAKGQEESRRDVADVEDDGSDEDMDDPDEG